MMKQVQHDKNWIAASLLSQLLAMTGEDQAMQQRRSSHGVTQF
jgi:hypothetical protein